MSTEMPVPEPNPVPIPVPTPIYPQCRPCKYDGETEGQILAELLKQGLNQQKIMRKLGIEE